jgi:hypothetical protein
LVFFFCIFLEGSNAIFCLYGEKFATNTGYQNIVCALRWKNDSLIFVSPSVNVINV